MNSDMACFIISLRNEFGNELHKTLTLNVLSVLVALLCITYIMRSNTLITKSISYAKLFLVIAIRKHI